MANRSMVLAGVLIGLFLSTPVGAHQSADQIVKSLQKDWPAAISGHASVVEAGRTMIVTVTLNQAASDTDLLKFAANLAGHILGDTAQQTDELMVIYQTAGTNEHIKSVSLTRPQWQSIAANADPAAGISIQDAQLSVGDFSAAPNAVASAAGSTSSVEPLKASATTAVVTTAPAGLEAEHAALLGRIETLQKKGVGTENYLAMLNDAENLYRQGNTQTAKEDLSRLSDAVQEQEKLLASRSTVRLSAKASQSVAFSPVMTITPKAPMPVTPPGARPPAGPNLKAEQGQKDALNEFLGRSVTELQGMTEKQAIASVAREFLQRTLGPDCPNEGPFLAERIKIGRRIQELSYKKINVSPYRAYDRDRIESLVLRKDPRVLNELASNIEYLEMQLGISKFQSEKKKH